MKTLLLLLAVASLPAAAAPPDDALDKLVLAAGTPAPTFALAQADVAAPAPVVVTAPTVGQQIAAGVIQYVVVPLLMPIGALLVWALKKLVDYLNEKGKESAAARIAAKLTGAAASAVAEINATLRPKLEAALADGVLTDKEKAELKEAALALLKTKLPGELLQAAGGIFGGFLDTYLGGLIERQVLEQKVTAAQAAQGQAIAESAARPQPA